MVAVRQTHPNASPGDDAEIHSRCGPGSNETNPNPPSHNRRPAQRQRAKHSVKVPSNESSIQILDLRRRLLADKIRERDNRGPRGRREQSRTHYDQNPGHIIRRYGGSRGRQRANRSHNRPPPVGSGDSSRTERSHDST